MTAVGVHLAGCTVLVVAGFAKLWRPRELAIALSRWRCASRVATSVVVRAVATIEVVLGVLGVIRPAGAAAALVALSYLGFTAYVLSLRRTGAAVSSCGCFGEPDTPATRAHVAVTATFAIASAAVAISGHAGLRAVLDAQPASGLPILLAAAVVALLATLVLTRHAAVQAARALYTARAA